MSLALFATYVLTSPDNILSPDKVFVTFSIINILQFPISQLPRAVNQISQAVIAVNRITRFLMLEEKDDDVVMYDEYMGKGQDGHEAAPRDVKQCHLAPLIVTLVDNVLRLQLKY